MKETGSVCCSLTTTDLWFSTEEEKLAFKLPSGNGIYLSLLIPEKGLFASDTGFVVPQCRSCAFQLQNVFLGGS